jgi:hypothetical protein
VAPVQGQAQDLHSALYRDLDPLKKDLRVLFLPVPGREVGDLRLPCTNLQVLFLSPPGDAF